MSQFREIEKHHNYDVDEGEDKKAQDSLLKQLAWLVLIWSLGVISLILFAQIIRTIMNFVGLATP